jgi:hypothetical protein
MLQRYRNSRKYIRRKRSKSCDSNEPQQLCKDASPFYVPDQISDKIQTVDVGAP